MDYVITVKIAEGTASANASVIKQLNDALLNLPASLGVTVSSIHSVEPTEDPIADPVTDPVEDPVTEPVEDPIAEP